MNSSESALKIDMYLRRENRSIGFHPGMAKTWDFLFFVVKEEVDQLKGENFRLQVQMKELAESVTK